MQLYNNSGTFILITDILVDGYPPEFAPGETKTMYDADVSKSQQITAAVNSSALQVVGTTQPNDLIGSTTVNEIVFTNGVTMQVFGDTIVFENAANTKSATITLSPGGY